MFFIIVISIYLIGNVYVYIRGWQALELLGKYRIGYSIVFWLLASLFILSNVLRFTAPNGGAWLDVLYSIGTFWMALLLYAFLIVLAIDIIRFIAWTIPVEPTFIHYDYPLTKIIVFGLVSLSLATILIAGHRNARTPRISHVEIPVAKQAGNLSRLRIAMVSDIHLGHGTGRKFLEKVVNKINEQDADIVLIVGDTFDGAPDPVIRENMGVEFDRLKSRYGTWVVSGNHEYIGEREEKDAVIIAFDYLSAHKVTPLQDTVVFVDNSFYLAGRKDRQAGDRKTVSGLLEGVDKQFPVILLDHQPYHLEKAQQAGVDIQFSGHTHHGQLWPLSLLTARMYEKDWGYLQKDSTHYYISCGVSVWGPAVRTAGYSEIVVADIKFDQ